MISNPGERHVIYMLLVDTSGSMAGAAIDELNEGLRLFGDALQEDPWHSGCADICVVKFDSTVEVVVPFCSAGQYHPPVLKAGGLTALNRALLTGLDLIEQRTRAYKNMGVNYYKSRMLLLTDGTALDTDLRAEAHRRIQDAQRNGKVDFFPMGVGNDVDIAELRSYTKNGHGMVLRAEKEHFKETFIYLIS